MRTLVLDIENSFVLGGVWNLWNQNLSIDQVLDGGRMLCWAAKWLGEKEVLFRRLDDVEFLDHLHELLDQADAVMTYNGRRHDLPMINREFLLHGYPPPSPYKHIDLLETSKKAFKFPSNKMQYLLTELDLGSKLEHEGFKLWIKCMEGDPKAWKIMKRYNIQDVKVLEKLYYKLQPWIANHPNHSLFSEKRVCPNCGSKHLQSRGYYLTSVGKYQRFRCSDCGKWSRARFTELDLQTRKNLVVGIQS